MKYIIHVNRQVIGYNSKVADPNKFLPTYIVREGKKVTYAYAVKMLGPSVLIDQRVNKQLTCGARNWIETDGPIELTNPMTFQEMQDIKRSNR